MKKLATIMALSFFMFNLSAAEAGAVENGNNVEQEVVTSAGDCYQLLKNGTMLVKEGDNPWKQVEDDFVMIKTLNGVFIVSSKDENGKFGQFS